MSIEYDEKGKYYTDIIKKLPVSVVIQTSVHLIRGFVHVKQGERLKNELECDENFLAVTDASVIGSGDKVLFSVPFMAVGRSHIIWVLPTNEKEEDTSE